MTPSLARRIARYALRKPHPQNGTQYRNRINQAAYKYKVPERRVHTALFDYNPNQRTEWYPEQVTPI